MEVCWGRGRNGSWSGLTSGILGKLSDVHFTTKGSGVASHPPTMKVKDQKR
jgi:hypothetical protein